MLACVAGGAVVAGGTVVAPLLVPAVRAVDRARSLASLRFALDAPGRAVLIRVGGASVGGAVLVVVLGIDRGYWVMITIVAVLQAGRGRRLTVVRGVHRMLGTVIGASLFALVATLLGLPARGLLLAVALEALQFVIELVVVRHYGAALVGITPLALLIAEAGMRGDPWTIAGARVIDTAVGCAVAALALLVEAAVTHRRH